MNDKKIEMNVELMGVERIFTLVSILNNHKESLSDELIDKINELMDCEHIEINHAVWMKDFGGKFTCEPHIEEVESINPVLKTIKFGAKNKDGTLKLIGDSVVLGVKKLESFKAFSDGKLVIQW